MGSRAKSGERRGETAKQLMNSLLDEIDEERARRLRHEFGQRRWILSWNREVEGWVARLSGPGVAETIEQVGRTRVEAVERAAVALREALPKS